MLQKNFWIQITFNNSNIAYFSNKKYSVAIQTRQTQIVNTIFLIEKLVLTEFLQIIDVPNQLPITFGTVLI